MKVLWVSGPTEVEHDVRDDCELAGIECVFVDVYKNVTRDLPLRIRAEAADLTVLRHPFYLAEKPDLIQEIDAIGLRVVAWSSEQGPTKNDGECLIGPFRHRAVNNARDAAAGGYLRMPFGCAVRPLERSGTPLGAVADSNRPHYGCRTCGGDMKARSVETMVLPLIGTDLGLYGIWFGDCGWSAVPGASPHYQGEFADAEISQTLSRYGVYVGISWNWKTAGYGCKLARAMATGIPVVWHRTPHMADDGLEEGKNILCSSSPEETKERVAEALAKPEIGARGRDFAIEHWRWSTLLQRLHHDIS